MKLDIVLRTHAANLAGLSSDDLNDCTVEQLMLYAKMHEERSSALSYKPVTDALARVEAKQPIRESLEQMYQTDSLALYRARGGAPQFRIGKLAEVSQSVICRFETGRFGMLGDKVLLHVLTIYAKYEQLTFGDVT
jgi:hypothetical protein